MGVTYSCYNVVKFPYSGSSYLLAARLGQYLASGNTGEHGKPTPFGNRKNTGQSADDISIRVS